MLYTVLVIILILALLGGIPNNFYGQGPFLGGGGLGLVILILVILILTGRL